MNPDQPQNAAEVAEFAAFMERWEHLFKVASAIDQLSRQLNGLLEGATYGFFEAPIELTEQLNQLQATINQFAPFMSITNEPQAGHLQVPVFGDGQAPWATRNNT